MYKTESFYNFGEYATWLKEIQKEQQIEIIATAEFGNLLIVTYKNL